MCGCVAVVIGMALGVIAIVPEIGAGLRADQSELEWIADALPLTVAALLLPAGAVLDRFGRRRGILTGLAILIGSLVWSAASGSAAELIAARVASGLGLAMVFPGTLATISEATPDRGRLAAVGMWGISGIIGGVGGMDLCAVSADAVSWRAAFWAFAAVCLCLFVLTARAVPETPRSGRAGFDVIGALLSIVGVALLVLGITEGPVHGWTGPVTVAGILGGVAVLGLFTTWELHRRHPLLDVRVYADARFSAASIAIFGMMIADFTMIFLVFQYEAYVLHFSPVTAALGIAPPGVIMVVVVPLAIVLAPRWGERAVVTLALSSCAAGTLISALVASGSPSYLAMISGTILIWAGIGFGVIAPTVSILDGLPSAKQSVASAVNDLTRELAAALGIAIAGSAFAAGYHHDVLAALRHGTVGGSAQALLSSPANGLDAARRTAPALEGIVRHGVLHGWEVAFLAISGVIALCVICAGLRYPAGTVAGREPRQRGT